MESRAGWQWPTCTIPPCAPRSGARRGRGDGGAGILYFTVARVLTILSPTPGRIPARILTALYPRQMLETLTKAQLRFEKLLADLPVQLRNLM